MARDSEENKPSNLARVEYQNGFDDRDSEENSNLANVEYQNSFDARDSEENSNLARVEYQKGFNAQDSKEQSNLEIARAEYQNGFDVKDSEKDSNLARAEYLNRFDGPLYKNCHGLQGMYRVASVHSNHHEDRVWTWECRNVVSSGHISGCSSQGYANYWDSPMNFMCPVNQYIAGVESHHDNGREDRRWKFTCCGIHHRITYSCRQTGYVNDWDAPMNFYANHGEVITGVFSYHDNGRE